MTYEEALTWAMNQMKTPPRRNGRTLLLTIAKALEKQIPKKYEVWNGQCGCPNCKKLFGDESTIKKLISWNMDYCKYCGQAIDWSDNE